MKYCKKCLQPDTRPNILFDENQVCYACKFEEEKKNINWAEREAALKVIAEEAKAKAKETNCPYDCVIGVSGGKDSTFQAFYAKEKLGLKALLVNGAPDGITEIGRKNLDNLISKGFDLISLRPNPNISRELARRAFLNEGNIVKPSEYALWASAYIIADKFNVPLIIQGENAAVTLGVASKQKTDGDAFGVVDLNTLGGCRAQDLVYEGITERDLSMYDFPSFENFKKNGTRAVWLSHYAKEWSSVANADFAIARGLVGTQDDLKELGRYRRYAALDGDATVVNQMLKYLKFGFGFASDEACYDIREGRISREDAIWLVKEYDGKCGEKYIEKFCDYIEITKDEFWDTVDKFVNTKLFTKVAKGKYVPKFEVGVDFKE